MPSLASSSDGTSPGDAANAYQKAVASTPSKVEERSGADALLMAAAAMTEFANSPPPSLQKLTEALRSTSSGSKENGVGASKRSISFVGDDSSEDSPSSLKKLKAGPCEV